MKEQSNLSAENNPVAARASDPEHDSIALIETEMDALRERMKRLESRLLRLNGNSSSVPLSAAPLPRNSGTPESQSNIILTPASSNVSTNSTTHRRSNKKSTGVKTKRTSRKPRKTRSSKVKRNLLLGYGLLIGTGVAAVFVLMILNLFSGDIYLPKTSSTATVELEVDSAPDLEELRMSIQDAEE